MLFLNSWFYLCLIVVAGVYRALPRTFRLQWVLVWTVGWLGWALPQTLATFAVISGIAWAAGEWIARRPDRASVRAKISTCGLVAAVVVARLVWPVFGGLHISTSHELHDAFAVIGIAYLALKVHHYFRVVAYESENRLSLLSLFLYFSYLPTITAGPILRVAEWRALARCETTEPPWLDFDIGTRRVIWGLAKKVLAVPFLGALCDALPDRVSAAVTIPASLVAIYFDFSGYSDIAVGSARLMGARVRENFDAPFSSTSLSHFWRRWHITMGDWLREHLFIPMGGMRTSRGRAAGLSALVMLFCGAWHAFDLRFLLWGLYHGTLLLAEGLLGIKPLPPSAPSRRIAVRRALVFAVMCGSTIFFIPDFW